ncbi:hypothetical protein D3P96_06665 [Weissella viridescens]|uniref:Uncharacterized protein n=1 Tax=Weissella viridescens TaxID=1629 RepID=A0A3P2REM3_WEIVI|nr:hypothetical protein [Weissella viridescens]RRG17631.1 hypothetical protein D3P96_06665 [Weissella viridescens]
MRKGIISIIVATAVIGGAGTYGYAEMNAQHQAETQKSQSSSHADSVKAASKSTSQKLASDANASSSKTDASQTTASESNQTGSTSSSMAASDASTSRTTDTATSQTPTTQASSEQSTSGTQSSAQSSIDPNNPNLTPAQIAQLSPADQATNLRAAAAQDPTRFKMDSAIVMGYSNSAIQSVPAWSHYSDSEINHFRSQDQ